QDAIEQFFLSPNLFQLQNIGDEVFQGAEFAFRSSPVSKLTFNSNYTYLNRSSNSNPAFVFSGSPRHKVFAAAVYRLLNPLQVLASARYEGGRISQDDAGVFSRATNFALLNLGGVFQLRRSLEFQAGIDNLLDRNYFYVEGYPEVGRAWFLNIRY